jgi:hypothetical protein
MMTLEWEVTATTLAKVGGSAMAYLAKTQVKETREALKVAFPDFKFMVRKSNGGAGSINVSIMSGPLDFGVIREGKSVNPYHIATGYEPHVVPFLEAVIKVIKFGTERQWYDRSDAMTDYFDTAFYIDLEIGRFMQPYKFTKARKLKGSTNYDQAADNAIAWKRLGAVA